MPRYRHGSEEAKASRTRNRQPGTSAQQTPEDRAILAYRQGDPSPVFLRARTEVAGGVTVVTVFRKSKGATVDLAVYELSESGELTRRQ